MKQAELREHWTRLGEAAQRADIDRLREPSLEEGLRLFEELCREVHGEFDEPDMPESHAIGISKFWKDLGTHPTR